MRSTLVVLAICSLSLSGCGTFSDAFCGPINDHVYYRGVRLDVAAVKEGGSLTLMAADIPFSAVADTILLPILVFGELTQPPRASLRSIEDQAKPNLLKPDAVLRPKPED